MSALIALVALVVGPSPALASELRTDLTMTRKTQEALTPQKVLELAKQGNARFLRGEPYPRDALHDKRKTAGGQHPMAVILSCIDSRAPAEIIFDSGIGDLFNARVAGNVENPDIAGSIEFATKVAGAGLVLVMGHTRCGAVRGACEHVEMGNLTGLLEKISPAIDRVDDFQGEKVCSNYDYVDAIARENVRLTVQRLRDASPILRDLEAKGEVLLVGSMYDVSTGKVEFLDDSPKAQTSRPRTEG